MTPDEAMVQGAIALKGTYATIPGRGVALLAPLRGKGSARPRRLRVEQKDRDFIPGVLAVPLGSTVNIPNSDPVFHNVFSLSPTKPFDLGVFKQGESRDVVFDKTGVVQVLCNLHASMSAYLVVYDEPHGTITDRAGRFTFRHLSPGKYRLSIWHERASEWLRKDIEVSAGANPIKVAMTADQAPTVPPNKEGKPRGAGSAQRPRP
jgi:plastocyanin